MASGLSSGRDISRGLADVDAALPSANLRLKSAANTGEAENDSYSQLLPF